MNERELIKATMYRLRQRHTDKSVRLQPSVAHPLSGVFEVHVRPQHAKRVEDLDWELVEAGELELIAQNNGVFRAQNRT